MGFFITRLLFMLHFIKMNVAIEDNLTYVNTPLPWINATVHCDNLGLVMASNKDDIDFRLQHCIYQNQQIWLGEYEELTEWAYIKGCFIIDFNPNDEPINVDVGDRLTCQKLCKLHTFFGEKHGNCFCLNDVTDYKECACNNLNCVTVWEHHLENLNVHGGQTGNCIRVTGCEEGIIQRTYYSCEFNFYTTCENGVKIEYNSNSQLEAANKCYNNGSFIKWYTQIDCKNVLFNMYYWTSGRREEMRFSIFKYDEVDSERLLKCYSYDGKKETSHDNRQCQTETKTFFCRGENNDDWLLSKNQVTNKQQSSSVGVVIGAVLGGVFVAVLAVIIVIFLKRRYDKAHDDTCNNRYDDLSPNLRACEADYQTIQLGIENNKNNTNEHLETKQ